MINKLLNVKQEVINYINCYSEKEVMDGPCDLSIDDISLKISI